MIYQVYVEIWRRVTQMPRVQFCYSQWRSKVYFRPPQESGIFLHWLENRFLMDTNYRSARIPFLGSFYTNWRCSEYKWEYFIIWYYWLFIGRTADSELDYWSVFDYDWYMDYPSERIIHFKVYI